MEARSATLLFGIACKSTRAINRASWPVTSEVVNWGPNEELVLAMGQSDWSYTWNRKPKFTDPVDSIISIFSFVESYFENSSYLFSGSRIVNINSTFVLIFVIDFGNCVWRIFFFFFWIIHRFIQSYFNIDF